VKNGCLSNFEKRWRIPGWDGTKPEARWQMLNASLNAIKRVVSAIKGSNPSQKPVPTTTEPGDLRSSENGVRMSLEGDINAQRSKMLPNQSGTVRFELNGFQTNTNADRLRLAIRLVVK